MKGNNINMRIIIGKARGKKLYKGDIVEFNGESCEVV